MKITLRAVGQLEKNLGRSEIEFDLPESSTLADLLGSLEKDLGDGIPAELWNFKEHRFRGPVILMTDGSIVRDLKSALRDGQEWVACRVLVGG
ncbi:MAG: hypothetical protein WCL50_12390 [Spirochaetota bacterium]